MNDLNQLFDTVRHEFEKPNPSKKNIISCLVAVHAEHFNTEYYNLVTNVFQQDPKFFMESIYLLFRKKLSSLFGDQKIKEMEIYILENFCLHEGEEILFEGDGSFQEVFPDSYKIEILDGTINITDRRIIAQGRLRTARMVSGGDLTLSILGGGAVRGRRDIKPKNAKGSLINASIDQELPCYGYEFPIAYLFDVQHSKHLITYKIIQECRLYKYKLSFSSSVSRDSIDKLLSVLKSNEREMLYKKGFRFKGPFESGIKSVGLDYTKSLVKALGGKINDGSTKNLSYFITNKPKSKYQKFEEKGIKILEEDFIDLIEGRSKIN